MRIEGVTAAPAFRREMRRDTGQYLERSRFSGDGYILDLTMEALRQTGRSNARLARWVLAPPDNYNEAGELAYYEPPERPSIVAPPAEVIADDPTPSPPIVSFVAFDGMLRSGERRNGGN